MVIYANQTLRSAYTAMEKLLKEMVTVERISDVKQEISSMKKIYEKLFLS